MVCQWTSEASEINRAHEGFHWVNGNPIFELVDVSYLEEIRVIAARDSFVAINQILAVDLAGQVASEGLGHRLLAAAGGQIPFIFGALLSKGGHSIIVLPSTATTKEGIVSRFMAILPPGAPVTIQRNYADYVVTKYGTVRHRGKTMLLLIPIFVLNWTKRRRGLNRPKQFLRRIGW